MSKYKTKIKADAGVQLTNESGSRVLQVDASGNIQSSSVTTAELANVSGLTSAAVSVDAVQTLTNKTLTSPVINSPTGITKTDVGLSNVDNTSDVNKPVSTAQSTAIGLKISSTEKGAVLGVATLDVSGLVPITQLPPAAIERLVIVADQTARFALTTTIVQNGDTVLQTDTNLMYFVKDDTNLNNASGYQIYTAGTASSVPWSGVTGTPTTIAGYGITDNIITSLTGEVTATGPGASAATVSNSAVTGKVLTGYVSGANSPISATDSILAAFQKTQGQVDARVSTVSGDIVPTSFSAANNQLTVANVTGLAFANGAIRSFNALVSVAINATGSLFESFELEGIQESAIWEMSVESRGNDSGVVFSITPSGQIQYTSTNVTGFVSDTIKFRAITTSV